jgi:hypothetical protein
MDEKIKIFNNIVKLTILKEFNQNLIIYDNHYENILKYINENKLHIISVYEFDEKINDAQIFSNIVKINVNLKIKFNFFNYVIFCK